MAAATQTLKTLSEHRQYLHQIVRLKLHFLHGWLRAHPEETFAYGLRNRVDIFRKTDINQGALNPTKFSWETPDPAWLTLEKQAEALYLRHQDDVQTFEEEAFAVFQPTIDARCERDFHDRSPRNGYRCGCLNPNKEAKVAGDKRILTFHIGNFLSPESFFDYPGYIRDSFRRLLLIAERDFQAGYIGTGTWLNSLPKWLDLFPQEWQDNLDPANQDVRWHYGFWGQFLTARQTFNERYGQILRTTGHMPYYPKNSHCSIKEMRAKIETM